MSRVVFIATTAAIVATAAIAGSVFGPALIAHPTAASPYTFHRDIVPIVEAKCGRCHGDDSVSGLSLFRYETARGATWRIRQKLIRGHMPPWFAEGAFKAPPRLTAHELNVLMTWATGGAPEGQAQPAKTPLSPEWTLGTPEMIIAMPSAVTVAGPQLDQVREVVLPSQQLRGKRIRAVDLAPGTRSIVRRAEFIWRSGARDQVLGLWQPGEAVEVIEGNGAFAVPRNGSLLVRIHYHRLDDGARDDRSRVGVYFASAGKRPIDTVDLHADAGRPAIHDVQRTLQIVAIRPVDGPSGAEVRLTVIGADGVRTEFARIQLHRDWFRRYVLSAPIEVAAGAAIELSILPPDSELWSSLTAELVELPRPVSVAVEFLN